MKPFSEVEHSQSGSPKILGFWGLIGVPENEQREFLGLKANAFWVKPKAGSPFKKRCHPERSKTIKKLFCAVEHFH